ncbi:MAG: glutathione S-transferase family protein [Roseobacter sp.]
MRLFYAPNTVSIAAAITLHEAQLPYDPVLVDFRQSEQSQPAYLDVNPKGRVPTLDTGGTMITETGAILEYIAAITPGAGLVPTDPADAAHMRSVMYYLASTMHVNHAHRVRGSRWADKADSHTDMQSKVADNMTENARHVQNHYLRGDYVLGEKLSLADPYLFIVCSWLRGDGVNLSALPAIDAYLSRMRSRASVQHVIEQGMLTV